MSWFPAMACSAVAISNARRYQEVSISEFTHWAADKITANETAILKIFEIFEIQSKINHRYETAFCQIQKGMNQLADENKELRKRIEELEEKMK